MIGGGDGSCAGVARASRTGRLLLQHRLVRLGQHRQRSADLDPQQRTVTFHHITERCADGHNASRGGAIGAWRLLHDADLNLTAPQLSQAAGGLICRPRYGRAQPYWNPLAACL